MNVMHIEQHFLLNMQRKVPEHGSDILYSAADIFMCEAPNSQLERAGYTGRLPEVGEPTNDPHHDKKRTL